jgi:hypothetical protein
MTQLAWSLLLVVLSVNTLGWADSGETCVIITGLGGMPEYEENFEKWGNSVETICRDELKALVHRLDGRTQRRTDVLSVFETTAADQNQTVWLFLIGHGTFDGRDYKFNIKGPDLTGNDLVNFFDALGSARMRAVVATSSSGGLIEELSGPNRVVMTATRSERERRPPLFMSFFIEGAGAAEADVNKDGKVSLQEVFTFSEQKLATWYEDRERIQTEHPVLDDSSHQASLAYLSAPPEQAYRSLEARNLAPGRQELERSIEDLKLRKGDLPLAEYYEQLEKLLVELAALNERIRELEGEE